MRVASRACRPSTSWRSRTSPRPGAEPASTSAKACAGSRACGCGSWARARAAGSWLDAPAARARPSPPAAAPERRGGGGPRRAAVPDLDRTVAELRAAGFDFRRLREGEPPAAPPSGVLPPGGADTRGRPGAGGNERRSRPNGPARLWGLSFLVDNLERTRRRSATCSAAATPLEQPPVRSIATLRPAARLGPAVAFVTPTRSNLTCRPAS